MNKIRHQFIFFFILIIDQMKNSQVVQSLQDAIKNQNGVSMFEAKISQSVLEYVDVGEFYDLPFDNIYNIIKKAGIGNSKSDVQNLCQLISGIANKYPEESVLLLNVLPSIFDEDSAIKIMGAFTHSEFLASYVKIQNDKDKIPEIDYDYRISSEKKKSEELIEKIDPFESASEDRLELLKSKIQNGFDIETTDKKERTVLHYAAMGGHLDIVKYLVDELHCTVDPLDYEEKTPLLKAAKNGHLDVIKCLHSHQASLTKHSNNGWYPIHSAAKWGHDNVIQYLLNNGVYIETPAENDQRTPLYVACQYGQLKTAAFLISRGANIYAANGREGFTPLHIASYNNHTDIIELLLSMGMDVNFKSRTQKTPLDSATYTNSEDAIMILKREGGISGRRQKQNYPRFKQNYDF